MKIFSSIVYHKKLENYNQINDSIEPYLDSISVQYDNDSLNQYKSLHHLYPQGAQTSRFVEKFRNMHTDKELKELRNSINKHIKIYLKELSIYDYDLEYLSAHSIDYINFQLPPHTDFYNNKFDGENLDILTINYYPKAGKDCGDLVLYNPFLFDYKNNKPFTGGNFFGISETKVNINISAGDICMHPFFMPHEVLKTDSKSNRLVIVHFIKVIRR